MLTPFALFFGLTIATAIIAYWSDNLGKKLGKKRVSLFGLRPRTTATILTIASSWAIMLFTLVTLLLVFEPLRSALFSFDRQRVLFREERQKNEQYRAVNARLQDSTRDLETQTQNAQDRAQTATFQAKTAQSKAQIANSQAQIARAKARAAQNQATIAQAQGRIAQSQAKIAQNQAKVAQNQAKVAQNQIRVANSQTRNARNQARSAQNQARTAQNQFENANFRLTAAQNRLQTTQNRVREVNADLRRANFNLQTANARLKTASTRLKTIQENFKVVGKQLDAGTQQAFLVGRQALAAERQVAQARQSIAEATLVVQTLLGQRDQLVAQNNALAIEDLRVSIGQTFAARMIASGQSQAQIESELRELLGDAEKAAPQLIPAARVQLVDLQLSGGGGEETVLNPAQIIEQLAQLLAQSGETASIRVVSIRNYTARETQIGARFVVVPLRPVFARGEVLGEISVDGAASNARIFNALSTQLIEIGRQTATRKGVNPPQSPDEPNFYANGTNEALFEALAAIKTLGKTARVRLVAAQDLTTVEPLRVRFEVEPPGVRA